MKKLISKVLLALITLSVATPVRAGVDLAAFKGIDSTVKKAAFSCLSGLGGAAVGGIAGFGTRFLTKTLGLTGALFAFKIIKKANERDEKRMDDIFMYGGALLGACAGIYLASRR